MGTEIEQRYNVDVTCARRGAIFGLSGTAEGTAQPV